MKQYLLVFTSTKILISLTLFWMNTGKTLLDATFAKNYFLRRFKIQDRPFFYWGVMIQFIWCTSIYDWLHWVFKSNKINNLYDFVVAEKTKLYRTVFKLRSMFHGQIGLKLKFCYVKFHISFPMQNLLGNLFLV